MADLGVLLSSSGRRVELLDLIRAAMTDLGVDGRVVAADAVATSPAAHLADAAVVLPRATAVEYPGALLEAVARHGIGLVVPTIDTELPVLAGLRDQLRGAGAHALVSGPLTVDIAGDKRRTARHLAAHGLPSPRQWSADEARAEAPSLPYPVIVKPAAGSASVGVRTAADAAQLVAGLGDTDVVQALVPGAEYTVDVWVDMGRAVSVVPRRRIEVRAGEVSKGVTERREDVADLARAVAESLPDADGPLTVQIMRDGGDHDGDLTVLEINARLGGGYPLSVHAGAATLRWAVQRALGRPREPERLAWDADVLMLRYDRSVIVRGWEPGT